MGTAFTAGDAHDVSGYKKIDFSIDENASVLEAVEQFVAHKIGALVTKNSQGKKRDWNISHNSSNNNNKSYPILTLVRFPIAQTGDLTGLVTERDYIVKVDLLKKDPANTKVKDICTQTNKLVTANTDESVQGCMAKMMSADIRHLPLVDHGELVGMISIKDLVKTCIKEQEQTIQTLSDFALGKATRYW